MSTRELVFSHVTRHRRVVIPVDEKCLHLVRDQGGIKQTANWSFGWSDLSVKVASRLRSSMLDMPPEDRLKSHIVSVPALAVQPFLTEKQSVKTE